MVSNQKYKPFNVGDIFFITNGKGITVNVKSCAYP